MSMLSAHVVPVDPSAHLFEVRLTIPNPAAEGQLLRLASWIPGSYLIREFAKNIVWVRATAEGRPVLVDKIDKDTWRLGRTDGPVTVTSQVYAWDLSVRAAHLDRTHGFFNGTSLFFQVVGQQDQPVRVTLEPPRDPACQGWKVATTLPRTSGGEWDFGTFQAKDYDELVDHPVEMGTFQVVSFEAEGVPHHLVLTGRCTFDASRLRADLAAICRQHLRFFGGPPPMDRYLFLTMVTGDGYGGLEHRASTALMTSRSALPLPSDTDRTDAYKGFLGLVSHEYFHTWNVKRIKPESFLPYRYNQENYTRQLWAFEGITSYYDDLGLLRAGCIDRQGWLDLVAKTATRVMRGSGRAVQSISESSFDAWTKFYRQDENAPNSIVSYYTKGALVALGTDLQIRLATGGTKSLDDVMVALWNRFGRDGIGVPEDGVEAMCSEVAGDDLRPWFDLAVRGTDDPPLGALLAQFGVAWEPRPQVDGADQGGLKDKVETERLLAQGDLGVRVTSARRGAKIAAVHLGGSAHRAGLSAGDVVLAVDGLRVSGKDLVARVAKLGAGARVRIHAFRRDELVEVEAELQSPPTTTIGLRLLADVTDEVAQRRDAWLGVPGADPGNSDRATSA